MVLHYQLAVFSLYLSVSLACFLLPLSVSPPAALSSVPFSFSFSFALSLSLISPGNEINYANSRFALSPITPPRQIALRGFVVGHKVSNAWWNARRRVLLKLFCSCDKTVFHMLTLRKNKRDSTDAREIRRGGRERTSREKRDDPTIFSLDINCKLRL